MNNMISTAKLMGGLGNQMFQIAHATAQGIKQNIESYFLNDAYTPMQASKPSKYIGNIYRNVKFLSFLPKTKIVTEQTWNEANLDFTWDTSIEFNGYYQSAKNFLGYDEYIKTLFSPSPEFLKKIYKRYPNLKKDSISVHIRRGDYLGIGDVLPTIDLSYIDACLDKCDDNQKVFLFSDDKKFLRDNFFGNRFIIVDNLEDYEEMWMMSLCTTNIISNSTFSWWGAYLNNKENKKVYVPSLWFGPKGPNPHFNIFEDEWEKINVNIIDGKLCC